MYCEARKVQSSSLLQDKISRTFESGVSSDVMWEYNMDRPTNGAVRSISGGLLSFSFNQLKSPEMVLFNAILIITYEALKAQK